MTGQLEWKVGRHVGCGRTVVNVPKGSYHSIPVYFILMAYNCMGCAMIIAAIAMQTIETIDVYLYGIRNRQSHTF